MELCEQTSGFPCQDQGEIEFPEGDATIVGVLDAGSSLDYTDEDGEEWQHVMEKPHQLIAIGDTEGNQALLIISANIKYTERGIVG